MSFLRRLVGRTGTDVQRADPLAFEEFVNYFNFNGLSYPFIQGTQGEKQEEPEGNFSGYANGIYKANTVVFAVVGTRMRVFSEARFQFRRIINGRPADLFGSQALRPLERPAGENAPQTTGDLLGRALQDVDLGGNWFARREAQQITRMRPDWVSIIAGSVTGDPQDAVPVGYLFHPGGPAAGRDPIIYLPEQIAHWAPIPDPEYQFTGMSWLTPALRDIMGDQAASSHKLRFMESGATPKVIVNVDPKVKDEAFARWISKFQYANEGIDKAYKTMFLGGGTTAQVVGANLRELSFKETQGAGETRIAAAGGVPPIMVGLSEGLQAATYSNYGQARRAFADITMRPLWRDFAGSVANLIDVPAGAELWYDARDVSFLQEDEQDAATIQQTESATVKTLIDAGFTPDSAVKAVDTKDLTALDHSGLVSVQLQPPGSTAESGNQIDPEVLASALLDALESRRVPQQMMDQAGRALRRLLPPSN